MDAFTDEIVNINVCRPGPKLSRKFCRFHHMYRLHHKSAVRLLNEFHLLAKFDTKLLTDSGR
jgi:hypothetical protein